MSNIDPENLKQKFVAGTVPKQPDFLQLIDLAGKVRGVEAGNGLELDEGSGNLKIDYEETSSQLAGTGLKNNSSKLNVDYDELLNALIPVGTIVAWGSTSNNPPKGWALCDGSTAGVPDLTGCFLMGNKTYGTNAVSDNRRILGTSSNASSLVLGHKLNINQIPSHDHQMTIMQEHSKSKNGTYMHYYLAPATGNNNNWRGNTNSKGGNQSHSHNVNVNALATKLKVAGQPKHYLVRYIMRVN
ncbi:phage tail protein [Vibrio sp. AND4]|uniref:phage tail protein n=1 Tax=Vibrio sp. AND4 TaxID=314289 RepID=UPI00015F2C01|nr:phage tail protein [Vibrio sp. AND4]EDP57970.1 hypothetical protein AND4_05349 [Vibrio sp. AND4]